jgi:hypothetical protein
MILDGQLCFTGGTALPNNGPTVAQAVTATADSTNIIDLGPATGATGIPTNAEPGAISNPTQPFRDIGIGDDPAMKLLVQCTTTWATLTSLVVNFQGAPDNGSGGTGSFSTYYATPSIVAANLVAGARLMDMDVPRPPPNLPEPRFLKLNFAVTGSNATNANVFAAIVIDRHDQIYNGTVNSVLGGYPAGIVVAN